MAIDTNYTGPAPWLQHAATGENQPYVQSFLSAYQTAKHESSPLYQAQVAGAQKQVERLGYQIVSDQLKNDAERAAMLEDLAGKKAVSRMAGVMAKNSVTGKWGTEEALAPILEIQQENPTEKGAQMLDFAQKKNQEAMRLAQAKAESDARIAADLKKTEMLVQGREKVAGMREPNTPVSFTTKVVDGTTFLINERTGAMHMVPKGITKRDFIAKNLTRWMESESVSADEATAKLSEVYDKNLANPTEQPQAPTTTVTNPGTERFKWENGRIVPVK